MKNSKKQDVVSKKKSTGNLVLPVLPLHSIPTMSGLPLFLA